MNYTFFFENWSLTNLRGVIKKYAEKCHYIHNFNRNYIIVVQNQAKFMPIWNLVFNFFKVQWRHFKRHHGNVRSRNPAHQYEKSVPSVLASTLAHNTMPFSLKIVYLAIHTLFAVFYPRKKKLSIQVTGISAIACWTATGRSAMSSNHLPFKTLLIGGKRITSCLVWWVRGWYKSSKPSLFIVSVVCAALWDDALSWWRIAVWSIPALFSLNHVWYPTCTDSPHT